MSKNQYDDAGNLIPPQKSGRGLNLVGHWTSVLTRAGEVIAKKEGYNVICTAGVNALVSYLASAAASATKNTFFHIAIGSDNTAETNTDTALGTELSRQSGVATAASAIYTVVATFASGSGTGSIYEYGLFDSSSAGNMLSRDTEGLITKGANDVLTVTAQITLS